MTASVPDDSFFMEKALRLAAKGRGRTSPNPLVGAVVVRDGAIVGKGCHEQVGGPHAEVNALRDAGQECRGGVLYVTLEPCNHQGRTPPCTEAVLKAGIARVVVGMNDPNPHVSGGGIARLRGEGLEVRTGVLEKECRRLNQPFIKHVTTGLPWVILKAAATLDGRIASRTGDARWISNERSRRFVHQLRCETDAILVGVGTALADDPQLTARLRRNPPCRQPVRIVLDERLRLPLESRLAQTARETPVWVACGIQAPAERAHELERSGVRVLRLQSAQGRVDLKELLEAMGREPLMSVLVEGGARVHGAFMERGLADECYFFYAPKILGDARAVPMVDGAAAETVAEARPVHEIRVRRFGGDVMLHGRFNRDLY